MHQTDENPKEIGDLVLIDTPKEINTYDIPELSFEDNEEKTQCFNTTRSIRQNKRFFYRTYSLICVATVFLTLIFSASELIRFVMADMGAHDVLMDRIFGYNIREVRDGKDLVELIINRAFADLSVKSEVPGGTTDPKEENNEILSPENDTSEDTESPVPPENEKAEASEPDSDVGTSPIISMDLSYISYGENYIHNDTSVKLSLDDYRSDELTLRYDAHSSEPLVLIIHTHATEAFMPEGVTCYKTDGEVARSTSKNENVIAVGEELARVLGENGINTIHCTIIHDEESYRLSYERSAETIAKYLKEYPSIQYVFDIHRDSIVRTSGELVKAVTSIDSKDYAQIMPVVSVGFEGFDENLTLATKLRDRLNQSYVNLCRPVCVRESVYNQDLAPVSILFEIGTSGNTLSEAKASASLLAEALSKIIKQE